VRVVAVTKGFGVDAWRAAAAAGADGIGENYAQELLAKAAEWGDAPRPPVHFVGRLQSNKVRALASVVNVWETIDRASLVDELARRAPGAHVLVQVNATGESDKGGCDPAALDDLVARARHAGLDVRGLMVVGPTSGHVGATRAAFALVRESAARLALPELSMGMSADLDVAVTEGSTCVRVGTALFGERPAARAPRD
jgi:pyridoxal phosphate enzyme (YggS family)